MDYGLKLLFIFGLISFAYAVGVFLFTRGFLLKRVVIDEHSSCEVIEGAQLLSNLPKPRNQTDGCWLRRKYDKAVILMIDALRYDFACYDSSLDENNTLPYQNKLKVIHEVLEKFPRRAQLFRFVADPPTTTMQRLKGITTGSLPTFVDAGSNFASSKITEDNIISQLNSLAKNITFMGDDTWVGLFPDAFRKSFPFPSFNVKDLHTVDNGVVKHLLPELKSQDWNVLIGHFLGVDHCGHRYGPYHPAMATKLTQMDAVIRSVIEVLDDNTVLFVMGDHGMTRTGDHGGDSDDELDAALFVYSAKPVTTCYWKKEVIRTVSQIDLVPTLSLLLGIPIPFGNLGTIIPDLLCQREAHVTQGDSTSQELLDQVTRHLYRTASFELNAAQVNRYLTKYASETGEISQTKLTDLVKILDNATTEVNKIKNFITSYGGYGELLTKAKSPELFYISEKLSAAEMMYASYLSQAKSLCQSLWAKFDLASSFVGILLLVLNIAAVLLLLCNMPHLVSPFNTLIKCSMMAIACAVVAAFVVVPSDLDLPFISATSLACGQLFGIVVLLWKSTFKKTGETLSGLSLFKPSLDSFVAIFFCFLQGAAMFSNSFVVNEDKQTAFFLQALITVQCFKALHKYEFGERKKLFLRSTQTLKKAKKEQREGKVTRIFLRLLLAWVVFGVSNRTALLFKACREEQWTCKPSDFLKPLSALADQYSTANDRLILTVICVGLIPLGVRQWLAYQGNLNGSSPGVLCVRYVLPLAFVLVCVHWVLQIAPQGFDKTLPSVLHLQQITLPRIVYCLCVLTVACFAYSPICVYTVFRGCRNSLSENIQTLRGVKDDSKIIPILFEELRQKWAENTKHAAENGRTDVENAPIVYGLATVYSSSFLVLFLAIVLPLAMILGDGVALSVCLMCVQMFLLLEVYGLCSDMESNKTKDNISGPSLSIVALWGLLATHYFYCTGHQATIPSIRFEAAFVGFPGDMKNLVLPGFLILLNTFAGPVLCAVCLPLLLFWHRIPNRLLGVANHGNSQSNKGEFDWIDNPEQLRNQLLRLLLMYQLLCALKLLSTCCSAILHRRHLMVWKIFAPRFVFEGVSFLLTAIVLVIVFLAVLRVDMSLQNWFRNLEKSSDTGTKNK